MQTKVQASLLDLTRQTFNAALRKQFVDRTVLIIAKYSGYSPCEARQEGFGERHTVNAFLLGLLVLHFCISAPTA
jgi:hypothetical protein